MALCDVGRVPIQRGRAILMFRISGEAWEFDVSRLLESVCRRFGRHFALLLQDHKGQGRENEGSITTRAVLSSKNQQLSYDTSKILKGKTCRQVTDIAAIGSMPTTPAPLLTMPEITPLSGD